MRADIVMYKGILQQEKIQQVREDIINILAEHDLNYGEARMILENFESFLEEQTKILKVSSKELLSSSGNNWFYGVSRGIGFHKGKITN